MLAIALSVPLLSLSFIIIRQDLRRMMIDAWALYALIGVAAAIAMVDPALDRISHVAGAALGLLVASMTDGAMRLRHKMEVFGFADVMIITAFGFLLGLPLVGYWIAGTSALAALAMVLAPRLSGARPDEMVGGRLLALPLAPFLIGTGLPLAALLHAGHL